MSEEPPTFPLVLTQRAAAAADQARRLRQAAAVVRRFAGTMKYHPSTAVRSEPSPLLTDALDVVAAVLNEVQRAAAERAEDEALADARRESAAARIRTQHGSLEHEAQLTTAAIQALRGVMTAAPGPRLDAPYGHSAPGRYHPGALCTVVAERAESLAGVLEMVAVFKANLAVGEP